MVLAFAVTVAMAAVLFRAVTEKARDLGPLAETIRALGAPPSIAPLAALAVTSAEILVALALLFRPDATATHAAIVALAALFALAGLLAMRRDEPIRCSCFGSGSAVLGRAQLIALIPWIGGAAMLRLTFASAPPLSSSAALFAGTSLGVAALAAAAVAKAQRDARADRRTAQEMNEWLPSY